VVPPPAASAAAPSPARRPHLPPGGAARPHLRPMAPKASLFVAALASACAAAPSAPAACSASDAACVLASARGAPGWVEHFSAAAAGPEQFHVNYGPTPDSAAVRWATAVNATAALRWGTSAAALSHAAVGATTRYVYSAKCEARATSLSAERAHAARACIPPAPLTPRRPRHVALPAHGQVRGAAARRAHLLPGRRRGVGALARPLLHVQPGRGRRLPLPHRLRRRHWRGRVGQHDRDARDRGGRARPRRQRRHQRRHQLRDGVREGRVRHVGRLLPHGVAARGDGAVDGHDREPR